MAKKDTFYFSHDANARHDPKMITLRRKTGMSGYGCFWMLIEYLREQANNELPLSIIPDLAYEYHIDETLLTDVVRNYELFTITSDAFYSARLKRSMDLYNATKEAKAAGARKTNEKLGRGKKDVDAKRVDSEQSADAKRVDSEQSADAIKEKEINKSNKKNEENGSKPSPPSFISVFDFFKEKTEWDESKCKVEAENFIKKYNLLGWLIDSKPILKWQNAAGGWIKSDLQFQCAATTIKHPDTWNAYHYGECNFSEKNEYVKHLTNTIGGRLGQNEQGYPVWKYPKSLLPEQSHPQITALTCIGKEKNR